MGASVSMILARGLHPQEAERFALVEPALGRVALATGKPIRVCEGSGDADGRKIAFRSGPSPMGEELLSVSAGEFLSMSPDRLVAMLG